MLVCCTAHKVWTSEYNYNTGTELTGWSRQHIIGVTHTAHWSSTPCAQYTWMAGSSLRHHALSTFTSLLICCSHFCHSWSPIYVLIPFHTCMSFTLSVCTCIYVLPIAEVIGRQIEALSLSLWSYSSPHHYCHWTGWYVSCLPPCCSHRKYEVNGANFWEIVFMVGRTMNQACPNKLVDVCMMWLRTSGWKEEWMREEGREEEREL